MVMSRRNLSSLPATSNTRATGKPRLSPANVKSNPEGGGVRDGFAFTAICKAAEAEPHRGNTCCNPSCRSSSNIYTLHIYNSIEMR